MTSERFYIHNQDIGNGKARLVGDEHHHLTRVLRKKAGDRCILFNNEGRFFNAEIEAIKPEETLLHIIDSSIRESGLRLSLGQSLLKSGRMDWIIQKSTELGIYEFFPVESERSVVRQDTISKNKIMRWERIALEAVKQSGRPGIPRIHQPVLLKTYLANRASLSEERFFLSERGGMPLHKIIRGMDENAAPSSVNILCGPEGGWTNMEEKNILGSGFRAVSLGPTVLRAETAALSALAIVSHFWSRST